MITIERSTTTRNAMGEPVDAWSTLAATWAEKLDLSDRERLAASEVSASITTRFRVLHSDAYADLNPKDRIVLEGRIYDIWGVKEVGFRAGFEITASARTDL